MVILYYILQINKVELFYLKFFVNLVLNIVKYAQV